MVLRQKMVDILVGKSKLASSSETNNRKMGKKKRESHILDIRTGKSKEESERSRTIQGEIDHQGEKPGVRTPAEKRPET